VGPEERHPVPLIAVAAQAHPDQVQMIRHQTIGRAKQTFTRCSVKHEFAEACMKRVCEPTRCAVVDGQCPVNEGVPLIVFPWQPRKPTRVRLPARTSHWTACRRGEPEPSRKEWTSDRRQLRRTTSGVLAQCSNPVSLAGVANTFSSLRPKPTGSAVRTRLHGRMLAAHPPFSAARIQSASAALSSMTTLPLLWLVMRVLPVKRLSVMTARRTDSPSSICGLSC